MKGKLISSEDFLKNIIVKLKFKEVPLAHKFYNGIRDNYFALEDLVIAADFQYKNYDLGIIEKSKDWKFYNEEFNQGRFISITQNILHFHEESIKIFSKWASSNHDVTDLALLISDLEDLE